jgi:hypothetical protein
VLLLISNSEGQEVQAVVKLNYFSSASECKKYASNVEVQAKDNFINAGTMCVKELHI